MQTTQNPHRLVDPADLRKQSNARYVNVPIRTRVTQRFEMYDPHSEEALRQLKAMGFTQVILDWPNLHSAATDLGLDVVLANWWIDKTPQEDIDKGIDLARQVDPDRLVGFSVMDEPGRKLARYAVRLLHRSVRKAQANVSTGVSVDATGNLALGADGRLGRPLLRLFFVPVRSCRCDANHALP